MKFEGIMTALVTPIDANGVVVEESLRELIRFQIKNKVQSVLILGGTGESVQLNMEQRKRAISIAVDEAGSALSVVAGLISPGLQDSIELGKYAKSAGAAAILVVTPYYVHPTQEGIMEYYEQVDRAVDMPLILYNIPYRTSVNLMPETVEKLVAKLPNIVGIKECTPNIGQIVDLVRRVGDKIVVLSGEEFFAVAEMILGAKGAVMASANVVPAVWVKLWQLVKDKDYDGAVQLNARYFPFFKAIFMEMNPGPLKSAMNMIHLPAGQLSAPLVAPSVETNKTLKELMQELDIVG